MFRKLLVLVLFVLILPLNSSAAADLKIGVIDFKAFMEHSKIGETIQKAIQDKGDQLKSELEKIQAELKASQERIKRESPLWTQEKRQEEESSFRQRINDFNKLKTENEREFAEFRSKKLNETKMNVIEYAEKKGKDEGYHLIFEKQTGAILYANSSINITDELIRDIGSIKTN